MNNSKDGSKTVRTVDDDGTKCYYDESSRYHREDGPAIEHIDGYKAWWSNGKTHRIDGPAVIYSDGDVDYYINNKLYSEEEYKVVRFFRR